MGRVVCKVFILPLILRREHLRITDAIAKSSRMINAIGSRREIVLCQMPTHISGSELASECGRLGVTGLHNIGTLLITTYEIVTVDRSSSLPLLRLSPAGWTSARQYLADFFRAAPH